MNVSSSLIREAAALIEERIGIAVHTQLRGSLDDVLHTLSNGNMREYINKLKTSRETSPTWKELVETLTIGETYFLRDENHFRILREHLLPNLIKKRREENRKTINIWSMGCASGEEPYSLAITLMELIPDSNSWSIQIIGTDINSKSLHAARVGFYRKWAFRHTTIDFQRRYFEPATNGLQIKNTIKNMVTFQHANLFRVSAMPPFDLILCRNVLIYFSETHTQQAETRFYDCLAPNGWLILGQSESLHHKPQRWITNQFPGFPIYQKPPKRVPDTGTLRRRLYTTLEQKRSTAELRAIILATYEDAVNSVHNEDYEGAEKIITHLLNTQPEHAAAHVLYASVLANNNRTKEAHKQLDIAIELDPLIADAYYLRALLYLEEDENTLASESLSAALYCQRRHPLASYILGNLHAGNGDLKRATRHWENALKSVNSLREDSPISDINNMTAGQLEALITEQLGGWQD